MAKKNVETPDKFETVFTIKEAIPFPYEFKIVVTDDLVAYETNLRKSFNDTCSKVVAGSSTGGLTPSAKGHATIHLVYPPRASINTIAHEVTHGVRNLMKFIGAKYDSEIYAYWNGWLTEEAAKFVYANSPKKKVDKGKEVMVR